MFKYINPGFAELLTFNGPNTFTTKNSDYNKLNGVSFSTNANDEYNYVTIPANIAEIYCVFNIYFVERKHYSTPYFGVRFGSSYYENCTGLLFYTSGPYATTLSLIACYNSNQSNKISISDYYNSGLQKIWLHIKRKVNEDDSNGIVEFSIDGGKTIITSEFDKAITLYQNLLFRATGNYFSNIIISDEYISPKEQIIKLPISTTESDMTFDSETGLYTATAANQSLLSAVNVNALAEEYGSDSQVTGVALVGNPAYKTAEGLSALTAFAKDSSGNVTNYGIHNLSDDTAGIISDSQALSNKTISDLRNMQFGWKAGG